MREQPERRGIFQLLRLLQLRTVLIIAVLFVIFGGGIVSSVVVIWQIGGTIVSNAQNRVGQDMNAAWAIYNYKLDNIRIRAEMIASYRSVSEMLRTGIPETPAHPNENEAFLQSIMQQNGLDFLTLTDKNGMVVARAAPPHGRDDVRSNNPLVKRALVGEVAASTEIMPKEDLTAEAAGLEHQAFMVIEPTEQAKPRLDKFETSGMVLMAAAPVKDLNGNILGVIYTGKLLNRNYEFVDEIKNTIYKDEKYHGKDVGTTTIFQGDLRISTNVMKKNGHRAIGTRVSAEVQDQVLENGRPWTGSAFVIKDWYITNYSPIYDSDHKIIGILCVGILRQKYLDIRNRVIAIFLAIVFIGSIIGIYYSYRISNTVNMPIQQLVNATEAIKQGDLSNKVRFTSFKELERLAESFNDMAGRLELMLKEKDVANREISRLNQHYIEMLGFVTHELKHPLGIFKGYLIMLLDGSLGALSPKQIDILSVMQRNAETVITMADKYLHMSKIERGELEVKKRPVMLFREIIFPLIQDERKYLETNEMTIELSDGGPEKDVEIKADPTLLQIVYNNLLQNAMHYGRRGGKITLSVREDDTQFLLSVRNEGLGIPPGQLETIFEKFMRLDRHIAGGIRGTGLGLFNSRFIVEKHGGRIWAESVEGEYADFIFTLPKYVPEEMLETARTITT